MGTKGKTYEQIYGKEKAAELRKTKFANIDRHRFAGKTYEEIQGVEKAAETKMKRRMQAGKPAMHAPRASEKSYYCSICNITLKARGAGLHIKMHNENRYTAPGQYKCANPFCYNMVSYNGNTCSIHCSRVLACSKPGVRQAMSVAKKKSLMANPESHPNRILAGSGISSKWASYPQLELFKLVASYYGEQTHLNFPVNTGITVRYVDVAISKIKMGFEYDGQQFHNEIDDKIRDNELSNCGWKLKHISGWKEFDILKEELKSIFGGIH